LASYAIADTVIAAYDAAALDVYLIYAESLAISVHAKLEFLALNSII